MSERNEYPLRVHINNRILSRVIIDQHYKEKHSNVTDEIILNLVSQISGRIFEIEDEEDSFQYFRVEPIFHKNAPYRMILLLCITDDYLGVINAFRVKR